jgi:hypothetical protein
MFVNIFLEIYIDRGDIGSKLSSMSALNLPPDGNDIGGQQRRQYQIAYT